MRSAVWLLAVCAACSETGVVGADAGPDADAQPADDAALDVRPDVQFGAPLPGLTAGAWTWVDFPGAQCRDGTATGIGVSPSATGSTKLMIFLEGGGACFNAATCAANPAHFDATTFAVQFQGVESNAGVFARGDAQNPVADWNMVYVPYCTGDLHAGNAPNAQVPGVLGAQQFVGYTNMTQYLYRLVPTFPNVTQVLLTGQSAGGLGAALEYVQVARDFWGVEVDLLDDAGPLMGNPYLAPCLETEQAALFGLTQTVIAQDCGSDCNDPGNDLLLYWEHLPKAYPNARFGLIDSTGDSVIASFFGYGAGGCTTLAPLSAAQYEAGLLGMRYAVAPYSNIGSFLYDGIDHTTLVAAYTTRTTPGADGGTVRFEDWVGALVAGSVTNVGP
jgi:hypothetical protein